MPSYPPSSSPSRRFPLTPREMRPAVSALNDDPNLQRKRQCISSLAQSSPFCKQPLSTSLSILIPSFTVEESRSCASSPSLSSHTLSPDWSSCNSDTSRESLFSPSHSLSRTSSINSNSCDSRSTSVARSSFSRNSDASSLKQVQYSNPSSLSSGRFRASSSLSPSPTPMTPTSEQQLQVTHEAGRASVTSILSRDMLRQWNLDTHSPLSSPPPPSLSQDNNKRALFGPSRDASSSRGSRFRAASFSEEFDRDAVPEVDTTVPMDHTPQPAMQRHHAPHTGGHHLPGGFSFRGDACSLFMSPGSSSDLSSSLLQTPGDDLFPPCPPRTLITHLHTPTETQILQTQTQLKSQAALLLSHPLAPPSGKTLTRHASEPAAALTPLPHCPARISAPRSCGSSSSSLFSTPQGARHRAQHTSGEDGEEDWSHSEPALALDLALFSQMMMALNDSSKKSPQISVQLATQRGIFASPTSAFAHHNSKIVV